MGPGLRHIVGLATVTALNAAAGEDEFELPFDADLKNTSLGTFMSMADNISDAERSIKKLFSDDDIMMSDVFAALVDISEATGPFGGIYSGVGRASSNAAQGIALAVEESGDGSFINSMRRALMLLGYTAYSTRPTEE